MTTRRDFIPWRKLGFHPFNWALPSETLLCPWQLHTSMTWPKPQQKTQPASALGHVTTILMLVTIFPSHDSHRCITPTLGQHSWRQWLNYSFQSFVKDRLGWGSWAKNTWLLRLLTPCSPSSNGSRLTKELQRTAWGSKRKNRRWEDQECTERVKGSGEKRLQKAVNQQQEEIRSWWENYHRNSELQCYELGEGKESF